MSKYYLSKRERWGAREGKQGKGKRKDEGEGNAQEKERVVRTRKNCRKARLFLECVIVCVCARLFSLQCENRRQIGHMDKSRRWPGCAKNQLVLPHCVVWQ